MVKIQQKSLKRNAGNKTGRSQATKCLAPSKKKSRSTLANRSLRRSTARSSKRSPKILRSSGPMPSASAESCIMCECEECEQNRKSMHKMADIVSNANLNMLLGRLNANDETQTTCSQPCFSLGQTWTKPTATLLTPKAKSVPNLVPEKYKGSKRNSRGKMRKRFKTTRKSTNLLRYVLKKKVTAPEKRSSARSICNNSQTFSFQCPCCKKFYMALQRLRDTGLWSSANEECVGKVSDAQHLSESRYIPQMHGNIGGNATPLESAGGRERGSNSRDECIRFPRTSYLLPAIWQDMSSHFGKRKEDRQKCARRPEEEHFIRSVFFPSAGVNWNKEAAETSGDKGNDNPDRLNSASSLGNERNDRKYCQLPSYEDILTELRDDHQKVPMPSGHAPTFISMVKTAIRDLKPFNVTSVEAISKYVQIRYHVVNEHLLRYILKWMVDLGVLRCVAGQYSFTHKRLVKKATVAVLRDKGGRRSFKRPRHGKLRLRRSKRKPKRKKLGRGKRRKTKHGIRRKGKRARKHKRGKKKVDSKQEPCTCSKEITSSRNRVKVRTRYIRRKGKIYKQDEYV